ncbi:MAG: double-strand break repair protein AddB [Chakrabartia sp.]
MSDRRSPSIYTIPPHRAFADALVTGLLAQYGKDRMAFARGIILVPNNRAGLAISDAFVRKAEGGLLLPRLVAVGDPELSEHIGAALDPMDTLAIPPAIDPLERHLILARLIQQQKSLLRDRTDAAEAMRLAAELARVSDQLGVEEVPLSRLAEIDVGALSSYWQQSLALLSIILDAWPAELARLGKIDLVDRRNRQLNRVAERWRETPPATFVIAAGISTAAPAVARVVKTIAHMAHGQVVFAGLDLSMPDEEWDTICGGEDRPPTETHPQFHLWQLLDRIGVARTEVQTWKWGSEADARAARAKAISNAMAPALFTGKWAELPAAERNLAGVHALTLDTPAHEAQTIAIVMRAAIEVPGRTVALVTPDRDLAGRVAAHLQRWGISADDSAGRPLSVTPIGTLILALTEAAVAEFSPASLLSLLKHPLVMAGDARLDWLDGVRALDLALRGPRPASGLIGVTHFLEKGDVRTAKLRAKALLWWQDVALLLTPLEAFFSGTAQTLPLLLVTLRESVQRLAGDSAWSGQDGRSAADLFANLEAAAHLGPEDVVAAVVPQLLRQLMAGIAIRPAQGGHPRIFIWGLLEAKLQSAHLMILGGLNEGVWPALPSPDPWLAPRVRRDLGLPSLERRIGLSAHDLAGGLGAPDVLLTRARRDTSAPTIASRFWLRIDTMTGGLNSPSLDYHALAHALDGAQTSPNRAKKPRPSPPISERPKVISVTDVDKLNADPFAFYAKTMLRLSRLDAVDADPGPAWRGSLIHMVLEQWAAQDAYDPDMLTKRMADAFADGRTHPLIRALWLPRINEAAQWIATEVAKNRAEGRKPILAEKRGTAKFGAITVSGIVDRIDRLSDGRLAIVDYKTGEPPSDRQVKEGFALQLGLIAMIAEDGGYTDKIESCAAFEYWSLSRKKSGGSFGWIRSPTAGKGVHKTDSDGFVRIVAAQFSAAAAKWLTGNEPFTAKLKPDYTYDEYDHLMRLEEWQGRDG